MTVSFMAMLLGLFVVPLVLLILGHKFRQKTHRQRAMFWWGLSGHVVAVVIATVAAFWPPAFWAATDTTRGLAGFWSLLLLPLLGAVIGFANGGSKSGKGGAKGAGKRHVAGSALT